MKDTGSESAILVIAKNDQDKSTAHFLAFTNDEGEAIQMAKNAIWPESTNVDGSGITCGGARRQFNQFTVKTVWDCEPISGKRLFHL